MDATVERDNKVLSEVSVTLAWAWAAGFMLAGLLGFIPNPLLGPQSLFVTNTAHNLVHVVTGAAFIGVALAGSGASIWFMKTFGVVYMVLGVLGFVFLMGAPTGYLLGLVHFNIMDNFLHLGLGVGILASGYAAAAKV